MTPASQGRAGSPAAPLSAAAAALILCLLLSAMTPGLFFFSLLSQGGGAQMPEEALAFCRGSFLWPLYGYGPERVTSRFGPRVSPGGIGSTDHKGIDIAAPAGTPVHAAAAGVVTVSAYSSVMGNYVELDHGGGVKTRYEHMSERLCRAGDEVAAGEIVGLVGSTGASTGNHLHFEVSVNGTRYDPLRIFQEQEDDPF